MPLKINILLFLFFAIFFINTNSVENSNAANNKANSNKNIVIKHKAKNLQPKTKIVKISANNKHIILHNKKNKRTIKRSSDPIYQENNFCFLAIDANTGDILFSQRANEKSHPASVTKLMTVYILFEQLKEKNLRLNSRIYFSHNASSKTRMKLDIKPGDSISVLEAIYAMIVLSANDVSAAVAEKISGSERNFGHLMTKKARELGMINTTFTNPHGLFHPSHKTTASDMLKLAYALQRNLPEYYHYFSYTNFKFRGREIKGHNQITQNYIGATGLKTGYIKAAGYNIVSSAQRNRKSVLAAVFGCKSSTQRVECMKKLLDASFNKLDSKNKSQIQNISF